MDWSTQVDAYCERLDPSFWAEPVNAVTNAAFLLAALWAGWRLWGHALVLGWLMVGVLAAIGVGSFLFHTFATGWAGAADTLPILVFVLLYTFAATRDFLGQRGLVAFGAVAAFFPFAAVGVPLARLAPWLGSSVGYAPVLAWIALFATLTRGAVSRGLWSAVGLLAVSLTFRTLDLPACDRLPLGTHFLWHLLNAVLLGRLIDLYRRHMVAAQGGQG